MDTCTGPYLLAAYVTDEPLCATTSSPVRVRIYLRDRSHLFARPSNSDDTSDIECIVPSGDTVHPELLILH